MTIDLDHVAKRLSYTELRHARNIETRLVTAYAILEATSRTLKALLISRSRGSGHQRQFSLADDHLHKQDKIVLSELCNRCETYIASTQEIQKRNEKLIQVVRVALAFDSTSLQLLDTDDR